MEFSLSVENWIESARFSVHFVSKRTESSHLGERGLEIQLNHRVRVSLVPKFSRNDAESTETNTSYDTKA